VSSASRIEVRTNSAPSKARSSSTPGGNDAWMIGISPRTPSDTSLRLAFDCRTTPTATALIPA
jgi:hypothetical protein